MNLNNALKIILKQEISCTNENVNLDDALGRTLSRSITIKKNIPAFDTSAMDGYALKQSALKKYKKFKILGEIAAGDISDFTLGSNECVKVYTGSRMPKNANFIVIQEDALIDGNFLYLNNFNIQRASDFVRKKGLDFKMGQKINHPLTVDFKLISALASLNQQKVSVFKKPKVCIIPTGNEILAVGSKARKNSIYSSSSYGIKSLLQDEGADVKISAICRDNLNDIACALKNSPTAQIIITLGGVSKGNYDLIRKHYKNLGIKILVDGISIRPGKPIIVGKIGKKIIFCLPGNPISSIVCSKLFIVSLIKKMMGFKRNGLCTRSALLYEDIENSNSKREHYMRAYAFQKGTNHYVKPFPQQDSSMHSVLIKSNCLLIIPPFSPPKIKGDIVEIIDF